MGWLGIICSCYKGSLKVGGMYIWELGVRLKSYERLQIQNMDVDIDFFKSIYNDDIIYHYTKASTAIDFILHNNQLRFNKARNSIDPIESSKARRATNYFGSEIDKNRSKQHYQEINGLHDLVDDLEERFNLICFCKNHMGEDFASKYYVSNFAGHEELFGFTKLRMWDQYADKFSGVCIAFSKEKILSLNSQKFDLIKDDVKYLPFQELLQKKIGDIQGNHLIHVGKEEYEKQLEQLAKESFFYKHIDYSGENEYRIGTLFEKDKCSLETIRDEIIIGRTMMLDISGCVAAIFVSSFANNRQKNDLLQYAYELNIEIIDMIWQHDSFKPWNYKKWIEFVNSIEHKKKESDKA